MKNSTPQENSPHQEHFETGKTLVKAVNDMARQVETLRAMEPLQIFRHPIKLLWYSFLKGLAFGFGSVLGASVLITLFAYFLSGLSNVPWVGSYIDELMAKPATTQQNSKEDLLIQKYQETKQSLENNVQ